MLTVKPDYISQSAKFLIRASQEAMSSTLHRGRRKVRKGNKITEERPASFSKVFEGINMVDPEHSLEDLHQTLKQEPWIQEQQ